MLNVQRILTTNKSVKRSSFVGKKIDLQFTLSRDVQLYKSTVLRRIFNKGHTNMDAAAYRGRCESARQFVFMAVLHKP